MFWELSIIIFLLDLVSCVHFKHKEIEQIGNRYELIDLDYDLYFDENNLKRVSFSAFGKEFSLFLELNNGMIGSQIKHRNGIPNDTLGYFTLLSESCHYHINKHYSNGIIGAASMCNKRGFRARMHTFNETYMIVPANYHLNLTFDSSDYYFHDLSHTHLIYKLSDYNDTEEQQKRDSMFSGMISDAIMKTKDNNKDDINIDRRLTESTLINNGIQNTEVLVIATVALYEDYFNEYGIGSYYEELVSFIADAINYVNDDYKNTDWGENIGTINIGFSELEVITSYTGDYASVAPVIVDGDVQSMDILYDFRDYLVASRSADDIADNTMIFTTDTMDAGGRAYMSAICSTTGRSMGVTNVGYKSYVRVLSHELGHNFGSIHDQDTSCGTQGGIMGYGKNDWMFSDCTIEQVNTFFSNDCNNNCECLANDITWFEDYPSESDINSCVKTTECVEIDNLQVTLNNGDVIDMSDVYMYEGCYEGYPYYIGLNSEYFLYYSIYWDENGGYHIYNEKSVSNTFAWCKDNDVSNCDFENGNDHWDLFDGSAWYNDYNADTSVSMTCDCVEITGNLEVVWDTQGVSYDLAGVYTYDGDYNGYPMYTSDIDGITWYLFYYDAWNGYAISHSLNAASHGYAYCVSNEATECGVGEWNAYINGWGNYDSDAACEFTICEVIEDPSDCVEITGNLEVVWDSQGVSYDLAGVYTYDSDHSGYPMYTCEIDGLTWYLYYYDAWNGYAIGQSLDSTSDAFAHCDIGPYNNPTHCNMGDWDAYINGWGNFDSDAACEYTDCVNTAGFTLSSHVHTNTNEEFLNDESEECDEYLNNFPCIGLSSFDIDANMNEMWYYHGCHNNKALYTMAATVGSDENSLFLYYSSDNLWTISNIIDTNEVSVAFCFEKDLFDCNGEWYNYNGESWNVNSLSNIEQTTCDDGFNLPLF